MDTVSEQVYRELYEGKPEYDPTVIDPRDIDPRIFQEAIASVQTEYKGVTVAPYILALLVKNRIISLLDEGCCYS